MSYYVKSVNATPLVSHALPIPHFHRWWTLERLVICFLTIVIDSAYTKGFEEYAARSENLYVVDVRLLQTNPIIFWMLPH